MSVRLPHRSVHGILGRRRLPFLVLVDPILHAYRTELVCR